MSYYFSNTWLDSMQEIYTYYPNFSIENIASNNYIIIYSNPGYDNIYFKKMNLFNKIDKVEIVEMNGRIIKIDKFVNNSINISDVPKVKYIIRIYTKGKIINSKFIKL